MGWDASAFHFDATLAGMLRSTPIGNQVVEVRQPCQQRLLTPFEMMEALHHERFPVDGVVGLIQQGAGDGHLRVCEYRIPPRLLGLKPLASMVAIGLPSGVCDMVRATPPPLAQGQHASALAPSCPVPQGVERGAEHLMERRRDGRELLREFDEHVAQADPEAHARKQRPQTLGGAVAATSEAPLDPL